MGTYVFRLPDIGEGVAEAEIVAWHVKVGDRVEEDQVLVDVMTDKATVEMTSPVSGVVRVLHGEVGSLVPVGSNLAEFATADGGAEAAPAAPTAPVAAEGPTEHAAPVERAAPAPAQAAAPHTASP